MAKISDPVQRRGLAEVMEELSGFATLLSRPDVMRLELDAVLSEIVGPAGGVLPQLPLLGYGVAWAFGRVGLRIRDGDGDVTDAFRAANGELLAQIESEFERRILAGPTDAETPELRTRGWDPYAAHRIAERRAAQEREQAKRFDAEDRWRRGRIRDVILAREVIVELFDMLYDGLSVRGAHFKVVAGDRDKARRLVRSMPSSEVSTELKRAAHRNRQSS